MGEIEIKRIIVFILSLFLFNGMFFTKIYAEEKDNLDVVVYEENSDDIIKFVWTKDSSYNTFGISRINSESDSQNLFLEYGINEEEAFKSNSVHVQRENVHYDQFEQIAPEGMGFDLEGNLATYSEDLFNQETFVHPRGYVTFTTKAYDLGYFDGGVVYHIEVEVELNKKFVQQMEDALVIQHGDNASVYDGIKPKGIAVRKYLGSQMREDEIIPDFANGFAYGVDFKFSLSKKTVSQNIYETKKVIGHHYITASDTTAVLPTYIHNFNIIKPSLSISYKSIGVGISSGANTEKMAATPMTLRGYKNFIKTEILDLSPNEYNFQPQYFFYQIEQTHNIRNWNFSTKRLRTGYIEEQYVNLSPNRKGAGEAYIEFYFNQEIHEVDIELAFWSSFEKISSTDSAYIQYRDKNGNWIQLLDIMDEKNVVPTDRQNPKRFELIILEGSKQIRIITNTADPKGDKNKGRISVGDIRFVSYSR
ncbi:hypothetical protein [Haploplasma axanthum]|uniref:Uncharacterized protein n=1 Tax=Haploplasma axanthum TaxID=29552 RepID=A0A449BFL0_HAPAX|nr:hypothetical protein [Haploplasma axanthum]VEU81232.1 Uncharacterised protein [Haploplasma axanthum]